LRAPPAADIRLFVRRALLRALADNNPFYLLSALFMLGGCYTLSRNLALGPGRTGSLLVLIGTLNVYEVLVIALALLLMPRGGRRDARILLLVEAVILLDGTFLDGEAFAADLTVGALVSAAILVLALAKVFVVAHASGWRRDWGFAFLLGQLALLLALPGLFALWAARSAISAVSPATVYAVWWLVAILVVVQAALAHRSRPAAEPKDEVEEALRGALSWMPCVSFALHLIGLGWVHRVPFSLAYLAPLVLALSAADILVELPWLKLKWQLPIVAIFLSLTAEPGLVPATLLGVPFSPVRLMLVAAGLTYLLGWRLHRYRPFAIGAALCLGGPAVWMGLPMLWRAGAVMTDWLGGLMPQTTAQWGVLAVILAFALLGLGALVSFSGAGSRPGGPTPPAAE
jgi:hypothetical protein